MQRGFPMHESFRGPHVPEHTRDAQAIAPPGPTRWKASRLREAAATAPSRTAPFASTDTSPRPGIVAFLPLRELTDVDPRPGCERAHAAASQVGLRVRRARPARRKEREAMATSMRMDAPPRAALDRRRATSNHRTSTWQPRRAAGRGSTAPVRNSGPLFSAARRRPPRALPGALRPRRGRAGAART